MPDRFRSRLTLPWLALLALTAVACGPREKVVYVPVPEPLAASTRPAPSPTPALLTDTRDRAGIRFVTEVYGALKVRAGDEGGVKDLDATIKPWSAWWLPLKDNSAFQGKDAQHLSPLEKYDAWALAAHNQTKAAAKYESENVYNANANTWEGHCDAAARASPPLSRATPRSRLEWHSFRSHRHQGAAR